METRVYAEIAWQAWDRLSERPLVVVVALLVAVLVLDLGRQLLQGPLTVARTGTLVWDGLMQGLVIGLAGVGLSMTYSILNFANFAHGDYVTSGAFAGWAVTYLVAGLGTADVASLLLLGAGGDVYGSELGIAVLATPVAVIAGAAVAAIAAVGVALAVDRLVFEPMREEGPIPLLIASVGVALALRYLIVFVFTTGVRGTTLATTALASTSIPLYDGYLTVTSHEVTLLVTALALMFGVHVLLQRTKLGKAMRAMADNEDLALVTGIPTERVVTYTWILGGGLAGVAGYLFVLWNGSIEYQLGWLLLLLIFAAVILGGIGSIYGAMVGGVLIGLGESMAVLWLPSDFSRAAAFAVMILILLVRPQGVFAGRATA